MFNRQKGRNGKGHVTSSTALKNKISDSLKYTEEQAENIRDYIKSIEIEKELKQHKKEVAITTFGILAFVGGLLLYLKKR